MSMLFIKCPTTGKPVPTGIDVPKEMNLGGFTNNSVNCPYCGKVHTWNGKDAFFQ
jgi:endogenous inhibitor of DNA gyrase (YacG/DUF329 family)